MKRIIDYGMVAHGDAQKFVNNVKEALSNGWQPFGNPFIDKGFDPKQYQTKSYLIQIMVRYEK